MVIGSDPVTVVANSVQCHDQSIELGIFDSDNALGPDRNEAALLRAGNISVVFVEKHSLIVLAVLIAKVGVNNTCHMLRGNVRTNQLVTNGTTPHV